MPRVSQKTWAQDLVEYFRELGGEAHYSDLYRHIEANPRRSLGKEWQAVVRRTIEEHSSDTSIWNKRRLPDLFRSVNGLGAGRWALRESPIREFPLRPGDRIKRTELHERFGGTQRGGISPSRQSPNVFIFSDAAAGSQHGYFDKWMDDGCFHYTGEGQRGDQEMTKGNAAILHHRREGRSLRLFSGSSDFVQYRGEVELAADQPCYLDDAPETDNGPLRQVIIFRLRPLSDLIRPTAVAESAPAEPTVIEVEIEEQHTTTATVTRTASEAEAVRREAALVQSFKAYVAATGLRATSKRIAPGGFGSAFRVDAFIRQLNLLIEAKANSSRESFRMAIGQLADYRRFLGKPQCAILVPTKPRKDLLDLARVEGIYVIWPSADGFASTANLWNEQTKEADERWHGPTRTDALTLHLSEVNDTRG